MRTSYEITKIIDSSINNIDLASSLSNANAGVAVNITAQGTGVHKIQKLIKMIKILFIFLVFIFVSSCGKKSAPVYKSQNHTKNIILN